MAVPIVNTLGCRSNMEDLLDKTSRIKDLIKDLKDKVHVGDIRHVVDLTKKLKNLDEKKLEQLEKAAKRLK